MRKILTATLILTLILVIFIPVSLRASEISVTINGTAVEFDVPPFIVDGHTMVPLRPIAEALRFYPEWQPETQEIVLRGEITLFLTIGSTEAHFARSLGFGGGEFGQLEIEVPPIIVDGRTFVPVRFIAESLDADVSWDGQTRTVVITSTSTVTRVDLANQDITDERLAEMVASGRIPANVTHLDLRINKISDISPLGGLVDLVELNLWGNQVSNVSPLGGLVDLTELNLWGNQVVDISTLGDLTNLTVFGLGDNPQFNGDISVLSNFPKLTSLSLGGYQISDFTALESLTNLENLSMWGVSGFTDFSVIGGLTNLTDLTINGARIINFSAIGNLQNLTHFDLQFNQVQFDDVSLLFLGTLTNLTHLSLDGNQISNIRGLNGLTNLTHLSLRSNQIHNVAPLAGLTNLTYLNLLNNQIRDITPLAGLTNLTQLTLSGNPIAD